MTCVYLSMYASKAMHEMLIPTNNHGFTVGGPKPVRHLYYVQLVISLDERLAHRT